MYLDWSLRNAAPTAVDAFFAEVWGPSTAAQTEFRFRWDVLAPGTTSPQVFLFVWNVRAAAAGLPLFRFAWNVIRPDPAFFFSWDVIQAALADAASRDQQRPISAMTRSPASTFTPTEWSVSGNLLTAAETWEARLTGTDLYWTRTPHDTVSLFAGLIDEAGNRQLYPVILNGVPNDRYFEATAGQPKASKISGRDQMAYLLTGQYAQVYRHGPTPAVVAGSANLAEKNGLFWASEIAADVVRAGGLRLAWQCPDYRIWNMFQAVGRPYDILRALVQPFSLHVARYVDVFTFSNVVYVRQRQLVPRVAPGATISAKDLRLARVNARVFSLPPIGRVSLRGRKLSGIATTPFGGVLIPHDAELLPSDGGAPVTIYPTLPPDADAALLPASGLGDASGTVQRPDGSTLGVGQVVLTANVTGLLEFDASPSWTIPSGAILRPDGRLQYLTGGTTVIVPAAVNVIVNSDGTTTRLHP